MTPFASRISKQDAWVLPVSLMCLVLGFMCCMAWVTQTTRSTRMNYLPADQKIRVNEAGVDIEAFQQMTTEVKKLHQDNTRLEQALSGHTSETQALNESLQELKLFAGMTPVVGPGVVVTLRDSPKFSGSGLDPGGTQPDSIIHDVDALKVCNELIASGAEAIAVNNHRIAGNSSLRCVGTTILVNDVKIASPVIIQAIGDPKTMIGAMNMPGGVLAEIRQTDPRMVQIEAVSSQMLPEYVGKTTRNFAKLAKESK